jgi:hypothetical protein
MEDIEVKFNALAGETFTPARCGRIRDSVMSLDKLKDTRELMRLLVADR